MLQSKGLMKGTGYKQSLLCKMKAIYFWLVLKISSAVKHTWISVHIFPSLSNSAASSTESVTIPVCGQGCEAVFQ